MTVAADMSARTVASLIVLCVGAWLAATRAAGESHVNTPPSRAEPPARARATATITVQRSEAQGEFGKGSEGFLDYWFE